MTKVDRREHPGFLGFVAGMAPGWFAAVMATGILSTGTLLMHLTVLSLVLLGLAGAFLILLLLTLALRLSFYFPAVLADLVAPERAFGFFTLVAGLDVVGVRLALSGLSLATACLGALAALAWVLLTYGVPLTQITRPKAAPSTAEMRAVNGTWFIWVVATQSLALAASALAPPAGGALLTLALCLWLVAVLLYLLIAGWVLGRLLLLPVAAEELSPPYWVAMGATAISVMAGARILSLGRTAPMVAAALPSLRVGSLALWCFGTWLFPLLLLLGAWRHGVKRQPLVFEPGLWSMVFPLGMYGTASILLGTSLRLGWLAAIGRAELPLGLAAWVLVVGLMVAAWAERGRSARVRG